MILGRYGPFSRYAETRVKYAAKEVNFTNINAKADVPTREMGLSLDDLFW